MTPGHLLCIAIPVPDPWGGQVDAARRILQPARRHMAAHITLIPPFRVTEDEMGDVLARAAEAIRAFEPFVIELRGAAAFGDASPTVFIPVVAGGGQCVSLRSRLDSEPTRSDGHPMVPHVTIVSRADAATMERAMQAFEGFDAEFAVGPVCVYELGSEGWTVITAADTAGTGA